MSTENNPESTPGFYHEELPRFDQRQAWTGRLEPGSSDQFVPVSDTEVLRFPAIRVSEPPDTRNSPLGRVKEVINTGTVQVSELRGVKAATKDLQSAVEKLQPPSEHLYSVHEILQKVIEGEEVTRGNEIIYRAAGHIATRNNLWIVTKSVATEAGHRRPRNIAVAHLLGLTFSDTVNGRPVLPVVSGKNGKPGKLDKVIQDYEGRTFPRVLEIFESTRTK